MAVGLHLATTSNLGIGILERRDSIALIVLDSTPHSARNPAAIPKCVTRAIAEEIGSFETEPADRIDHSIGECVFVEKIYGRSSATRGNHVRPS